jgi:FAD/FMN-containing dehydrogenase
MSEVSIATNGNTATIGGGARLIDVYAKLAEQNLVLPAGSCPTVGLAGLTLGGGVGVLGRKFGLTCDSLLSAEIVLADGRSLTCDQQQNADLYWALRGGGGGNFGIITSFTFQAYKVNNLTIFTYSWPWQQASTVVNSWQHWMSQMPAEIWSNCVLLAPPAKGNAPRVQVNGVYTGNVNEAIPLLQQLLNQVGSQPTGRYADNATIMETMMYEAGCSDKSLEQCHLPSQNSSGLLQRDLSHVKSDYVKEFLPTQAINTLVEAISKRYNSSVLGDGGIGMDSYGGAINQPGPDATAFAHRDARFSIQYSASWHADDSEDAVNANKAWLQDTWQAMRSYVSGASYQNYVDPDLQNWQNAYYGQNLARLQQIKTKYDPTNFFHFAQSIPLA